jgi:hypothetical protein
MMIRKYLTTEGKEVAEGHPEAHILLSAVEVADKAITQESKAIKTQTVKKTATNNKGK